MKWIIIIILLLIMVFLWLIARNAAHSIDSDTQSMLDDEQSQYIMDYFEKKEQAKGKRKT